MHTINSNRANAQIHYNSDWSGEAIITWRDANGEHEARVPAIIFVEAARRIVSGALEAVEDRAG